MLIRHSGRVTRDLMWNAIYTAAERLGERSPHGTLRIRARRRWSLLQWSVLEGLATQDSWTDIFEPVRKRALFSATWPEVQPVQEAAAKVGLYMRSRPDLN